MSDLTASERITNLQRRYLEQIPFISVERARFFTESWKETEREGLPLPVRVALAQKNVMDRMSVHIDPDDRIAGTWTEFFLGVPIDIERGLFNDVFAVELSRLSMIGRILSSTLRFLRYLIARDGLLGPIRTIRQSNAVGAAMPGIGTTPMDKRHVNPYRIKSRDRRLLLKKILPLWREKTVAEELGCRLKASGIYTGDMEGFFHALPTTTCKKDTIFSTGAAMGTWQGHLILDHETPIRRGLLAMREDVRRIISGTNETDTERYNFYRSVEIALDGVIDYAVRLAQHVGDLWECETDPRRKEILRAMHENCKAVPLLPAATFAQAVQSYWTVKTAVELAVPFNVHAPGRLDQYFYPFYEKDVGEGRITPPEARELMEELLLKIMTHNMRPDSNYNGAFGQRYEGSEPVTLGGLTPEGKSAVNDLTYLILEAAYTSKTALNIVVRIPPDGPDDLLMKVADLHYRGASSISMMNDTISIAAMRRYGFSDRDANDYAVTGCVDMCAPGKTGGIGFSSILLARVLDMTLRNGDSKTLVGMVRGVGKKTGDPVAFKTFDELVDAFVAQGAYMIEKIVKATHVRDELYAERLPAPFISAFMGGCLDKGLDVTRGGGVYDLEGILFMNSIANVVDSLFVIKKLVFEQNAFTITQLIEAVDHNFVGYEKIHRLIMRLDGKWGNGESQSDGIARTITTRLFEEPGRYRTFKGGPYAPFINSMTAHTFDGRVSLATPDGRKAAMPYAASCNPYNVDKNGITGVLRSVAAIDFSRVLGCAVNVRLHPTAVGRTEQGRRKYGSLITTYFSLGGQQIQPTVASTEMLRAAQKDPDSYRGLIVKVGGYSAYFVDLGLEIQNEIISRSEHATGS